MAYTQTQLNTLQAAIASGALTVKYADKTTIYRSLNEMKEIARDMTREINGSDSNPSKTVGIRSGKGL